MSANYLKALIVLPVIFLLGGCLGGKTVPQESIFIIWKSPAMNYADQGFLYQEPNGLKLEIYAGGQAVMRLSVNKTQICKGLLCMSKKEFNRQYLSSAYPDDFLVNILLGKVVFNGAGLTETKDGFRQKIAKGDLYAVDYSVQRTGSLVFRDSVNHIVIKINRQ